MQTPTLARHLPLSTVVRAERHSLAVRDAIRRHAAFLCSCVLAAVFATLYGWTLLQKEAQYQTFAYDLGLFAQVAWNTLHGHPFATTLLGFNYLADHLAPSLALVAPLFLLWPDARALLILQAVAVAAAGIGVFLATRQRTHDSPSALLIQVAYHLAPATAWVALDEFHPISLALPVMTLATAFLWRRRFALAVGCAALALLSTEDAVAWVAPFGLLALAVARGRARWWGAVLTGVAVAWICGYLFMLVPALRPPALLQSDPHPDIGVFIYCGRTWSAVAGCLVHHPGDTLQQALRPAGRETIAAILGPTAGLGVLGPSFLVVGGRWLVQLLSVGPGDYTQHYVALLVPTAYLAAGEAAGWLRRFRLSPRLPAFVVFVASLIAFAQRSPLPSGGGYAPPTPTQAARTALINQAVSLVPSDPSVSVVATSSIFPHLALRPHIYLPWAAPPEPDYYVLDLRDAYPITVAQLQQRTVLWLAEADYQILFDQSDVIVLHHDYQVPPNALTVAFGRAIQLQGYSCTSSNGSLTAQFIWRMTQPVGDQYRYFVHLVSNSGQGYSQHDGALISGLPATIPVPLNEPIRATVTLAAPPPSLWNQYHLEVGWYDWKTGMRLRLADGSGHVNLPLPS